MFQSSGLLQREETRDVSMSAEGVWQKAGGCAEGACGEEERPDSQCKKLPAGCHPQLHAGAGGSFRLQLKDLEAASDSS